MILVFHGLYDSVYAIACQDAKGGIFSVIPRAQHEKVSPLFDPEHHLVDLRQILQQFLLMFIHILAPVFIFQSLGKHASSLLSGRSIREATGHHKSSAAGPHPPTALRSGVEGESPACR